MRKLIVAIVCVSLVSGCATASHKIAATSVSPIIYNSLSCEQMVQEMHRVTSKANELAGRLDEAAKNDKLIFAAGMLVAWPALFALGGTKQQETEYAKLKGEHDALQSQYIQKNCS